MSQVTVRSVVYQIDGQTYEGRLAFDAEHKGADAHPVRRHQQTRARALVLGVELDGRQRRC